MTPLAHALSLALLHFIWQGPLIAAFLWIALELLRNASPRTRYALSCAGFALMIAAPFFTTFAVYRGPVSAAAPVGPPGDIAFGALALPPIGPAPAWFAALQAWALPVWSSGVFLCAIRLIWSSKQVAALRREGDAAGEATASAVARLRDRMRIGRPVQVLVSRLADSPCVVGWLRPVILIPAASLLSLTTEQLEAVLAHELAHIRRHDYLVNLLQTLAQTLFFYQPAVWWVSTRIRRERELCCDDIAVEVCGDAVLYARALANLERLRIAPALAIGAAAGPLLYRIRRLTGASAEQPPSKFTAGLAIALAAVCFLTNIHWAQAQPPQAAAGAVVRKDAIWVDSVKYGDFPILVRALGTIIAPSLVELEIPEQQAREIQIGQEASIQLRRSISMSGKVARIPTPAANNGALKVDIGLQNPAPEFQGQQCDGVIRIRTLSNVAFVGRPVSAGAGEMVLFRLEPDGLHAKRVKVRFGAFSVNAAQVLEGLQPGDRIILSDMAPYQRHERIRIE